MGRASIWVASLGSQVREKRTADIRHYGIDCTPLLADGETITSITSVSADTGALTFGDRSSNETPVTFPNGRVVPTGKVVQVLISGGTLPASSRALICVVRVLFATNLNPAIEATVLLRLVDTPQYEGRAWDVHPN